MIRIQTHRRHTMNFRLLLSTFLGLITSQVIAVPIVFHPYYDISFFGIEKLHPFDTKKYGKIAQHLKNSCNIPFKEFHTPSMITDAELSTIHTTRYLNSLNNSHVIAHIAEMPPLAYLPNFLLHRNMLNSMRYATAGTILGAQLALTHGWAVNLSGGYHHAKDNSGEGFCFFADIPLAIKKVREERPDLKVLIVDLDAHQGNGFESILGTDPLTFIFDMYSNYNYPSDYLARTYIDFNYPLATNIKDDEYLTILKTVLPTAIDSVKPDLIIYNAGTDIFENDPLGKMKISKAGIIERDFFVFSQAQHHHVPLLMVLSGGYSTESADIVGTSIEHIIKTLKLVDVTQQPAHKKEKFLK
jgi:histone deacetylase 11